MSEKMKDASGGGITNFALRFFRLTFFLCFLFSMQSYAEAQSKVSINLGKTSIKSVFDEIRKQTGKVVICNDNSLSLLNEVVANYGTVDVETLLGGVLSGSGMTFKYVDDYIVIVPMKNPQIVQNAIKVEGYVCDINRKPLPGVTVRIKGATIGTSTDKDGNYSLNIITNSESVVLVYSFVGMKVKEVKYNGKPRIDVVMEESAEELEEVVVNTGYQTIDLRNTTSAIQSIKAQDIVVPGLQSVDQMLEGYVPGMIFMQNSGQVGATPRLRIRGTSTILGSQEPVWVVDGIVQENPVDIDPSQINDLDFVNLLGNAISGLNPDDIEQIDILKDASATALYGAKAANGVIVITTKQGKIGAPALSYSFSGTFTRRPHYGDASVNMMDSRERVDLSRDLIKNRVAYPTVSEWLGYEKAIYDYWNGSIDYSRFTSEVGRAESMNTDWFDLLTQNSFSNKHTLSLSGGSPNVKYYVSLGLSDNKGTIRGEDQKSYTAAINLTANYKRLSAKFSLNGNVGKKKYTPSDVSVTQYAYETSRAVAPYDEDGDLWFYNKMMTSNTYSDFNIMNEKANSSQDIRSSGLTATAVVNVRFTDYLKASLTGSYSVNNTTQETWHGENTFYAASLRKTEQPSDNLLPQGGELIYQNTERYAYTARAQLDFGKYMDSQNLHFVSASAGGEVSSNQYYGLNEIYRGYLKDRGKKMASIVLSDYPAYESWKQSNSQALGAWTDKLTNIASAYATVSYTFDNRYTFNANMRIDGSNRFGSRANEKLAPIWSLSAKWNVKNDVLKKAKWVNVLSLLASFGYQGNMLETQSAQLVLDKQGIKDYFNEYYSTVNMYPNPDLKWEKTSSYNATLNFGFFDNRISGSFSYYYKRTQNAFVTKNISSVMGVSNWVVNDGEVENKGSELNLRFNIIDTRKHNINGVRWTMSPNFGSVFNSVKGKSTDKSLSSEISYQGLLNGTIEVEGRPLNSFYSYKYYCLDGATGIPVFRGTDRNVYENGQNVDLLEKYRNMTLDEVCKDVMVYSGTRVPKFQGGLQNSVLWKQFSLGLNLSYSFGNKIRLLQMYPNVDENRSTIAPRPTDNVRREFINRWRNPGDEQYSNIPAFVSSADFQKTISTAMWWYNQTNYKDQSIAFANNLWSMYDNSDLRTVSGNYVKIQSMSLRYNFSDNICKSMHISSAYVGFTSTNVHTFCNKKLKGQDPATQDGSAPTVNLSLRPTYSLSLNVSF